MEIKRTGDFSDARLTATAEYPANEATNAVSDYVAQDIAARVTAWCYQQMIDQALNGDVHALTPTGIADKDGVVNSTSHISYVRTYERKESPQPQRKLGTLNGRETLVDILRDELLKRLKGD